MFVVVGRSIWRLYGYADPYPHLISTTRSNEALRAQSSMEITGNIPSWGSMLVHKGFKVKVKVSTFSFF